MLVFFVVVVVRNKAKARFYWKRICQFSTKTKNCFFEPLYSLGKKWNTKIAIKYLQKRVETWSAFLRVWKAHLLAQIFFNYILHLKLLKMKLLNYIFITFSLVLIRPYVFRFFLFFFFLLKTLILFWQIKFLTE